MSDNVAQSIKDLNSQLQKADQGLIDFNTYWNNLVRSVQSGGTDIKAFFDYIAQKTDATKAQKLRLIYEMVDKDGKPLSYNTVKDYVDKLSKARANNTPKIKIGTEFVLSDDFTRRINEYKRYLDLLNKTPQELLSMANSTIGSAAGMSKKAWSPKTLKDTENLQQLENLNKGYNKTLKDQYGWQLKNSDLLAKRVELENKIKDKESSGNTRGLKTLKKQYEDVNREVGEYLAKVSNLGKAGERAMYGYKAAGLLTGKDSRQLDEERQRINLIRERNKLEQQSVQLRQSLVTKEMSGRLTVPYQERSSDQIAQNDKRILEIDRQLQSQRIQLTTETTQKIEQLERNHANSLTNIRNQGEQQRLLVQQQLSNQKAADARREQAQEEDAARRAREVRVAESRAAYEEQARLMKEQEKEANRIAAENTRKRIAEQRKADNESMANQRRQIQIKSELAALDKKMAVTGKNMTAEEKARYGSLSSELTKLIARQKELNAISQGSGSRGRERLQTYQISEADKALRRYEETWRRVKNAKQKSNVELSRMLPLVRRLGSALGLYFSAQGLVQFGRKLVETRGEFELQQVALRSILQNKQLADEIWGKTMQAALQSPFTAMQLTKYTKQLAAYRIETDKLFDTTKRLADVSAGLGVDMQRLILAYGQVKAANYLRASEIRQFTEAGVNVLGELTSYFNETRDGMYNTAKVMDMVQKRMVKFEDIEAIFKRMTDEGGIFYNMQYIQSQTVKGQINKLHDAYDQMLNSIGKANEGPIKNMIALLLNIVKNWREWKTVLDSILWPTLTIAVIKFSRGLLMVDASAKIASKSLHGLTLAGAKVRRSLSEILNMLKKFPVGGIWGVLGIGAAVVAVTALVNHAKAVAEINKEYDEQKNRLRETARSFEDYQRRVNENNETIKNRTKIAKDDVEAQEKLKKAQQDNKTIVNKLTSDYPEFAKSIKLASDKQADLSTIVNETNNKLRDQIALLEASKAGFGFDDLKTNISEFQGTTLTQEEQVRNNLDIAQNLYQDFLDWKNNEEEEARQKYEGNERKLQKRLKEIRETEPPSWITDIINAGTDAEAQTKAIQGIKNLKAEFISYGRALELKKLIKIPSGQEGVGFQKTQEETEKDLRQSLQRLGTRVRIIYRNELEKLNNGTIEDAKKYVAENGTIVDAWFKFGEGKGWKYLNENVVSLSKTLGVSIDEARKIVEEEVNKVLMSAYGKTIKLDWSKIETDSTYQETPEEKQSRIDAAWRRRIQLLEEMKKRYDELSKSAYGYAKSNTTVRTEFEKSWGKIFGGVLSMNAVQFTSAAEMEEAFETILAKASAASDAVKEEIQKKSDSYGARIPIDVQVRIREDFGRQMEEAFGNYELTLDLQKLNLPDDVLKDLFDIDAIDTPALRKELDRLYESLKDENGEVAEDSFKVYENWLKKIDDSEQKAQRERLKNYSKYLEYQVSERAKIEMEYARKVAEVQAESAFGGENEQLRSRILDGLKREYNEKIAKQDWEDFKGSEMYIQMMEDLTKQGTASLEIMRKKLIEVRDNAENLSPRALKEVINAIEKIDDEFYNRQSPFARIGKYKKEFEEAMSAAEYDNISGVFADDAAAKEDYENARKLHETYENIIGDKTTLADVTKKLKDITDEYNITGKTEAERIEDAKIQLETYRQSKNRDLSARNKLGGRTKDTASAFDFYTGNINVADAAIASLEKYIELTTEYTTLTEKLKGTDYENVSIEELSRLSKEQLDSMGWSEEEQKRLSNIINLWRRYNKAVSDGLAELSDYVSRIGSLYDDITGNLNALGVSTDVLDEQLLSSAKTAINSIKTIVDAFKEYKDATKEAVDNGKNLLEAGATGDYIRLALALLKVLIDVAAQIGLIKDASYEKQIQQQQLRLDALKDAYARLEKQIERTWSSVSYMQTYEQQMKNIREQISAMEAQMRAEEAKKNTDDNAVRQYQRDIQDAYDQLDELEQKSIEVFGGIGEEGYRSAAEGFVEAWKSAFLETGDGLQALQDHFDEFLQDWFVKQATMRIAGGMLEPVFRQIDAAVNKYGEGGTSAMLAEIERARDIAASIFPDLSAALENIAGMFSLEGEGSLSGLAAGIQGITEEQANILEAYWNSVRMYTASIDMNVARIAEMLGVGGANSNPMLQQMSLIAANTQATHQLLQSVTKSGHSLGGYGIKVFNN